MALAKKLGQLPIDGLMNLRPKQGWPFLAFLTHHGYTVWRQNTTGIYDPAKARWRVNPQGRRGVPDIIGFRNADGVFIGVEGTQDESRPRPAPRRPAHLPHRIKSC